MQISTGTVLPNGSTVLEFYGEHVICLWRNEFVVWTVNKETGECFWGHYFASLDLAVADFMRVSGLGLIRNGG